MTPDGSLVQKRQQLRRQLLRQYMALQCELVEGDPQASQYQRTIAAFRQTGHALINSGYEDDLDRLLRLHVLEGGLPMRAARSKRSRLPDLSVVETRRLS